MPFVITGGRVVPANITYAGKLSTTSLTGTSSLGPFTIGSPSGNRVVVAHLISGRPSGSNITSVTIGGVAATIAQSHYHASGTMHVIAYAVVPTGTTATVAYTYTGNFSDSGIMIFVDVMNDLVSTTPTFSWKDIAAAFSQAVTIPENGLISASQATFINGGTTTDWTTSTVSIAKADEISKLGNVLGGSLAIGSSVAGQSGNVNSVPGSNNAATQMGIIFN